MQATHTCLLLCFLLFFTYTEAQSDFFIKDVTLSVQPSLEVERGTNLTLTCNAQVSHAGGYIPQYTYIFYKDYQSANNMQPMEARGKETLQISQARVLHSGTYQCEVVIEGHKQKSETREVVVKGLQTPELTVDKLKLKEGENVSAICKAEEEQGSRLFYFQVDSKVQFHQKTSNGHMQSYFVLRKNANLSCSYTMDIASGRVKSNISNVVSVEVQELNFTPTIMIKPSTEVIEADTVSISCPVDPDYQNSPSLSLQLVKGTKILERDMKTRDYSKEVQAVDGGVYECNAIMNRIPKTASANLTVRELFSKPVMNISPYGTFEGEQFTVTCKSFEFASERIQKDAVKYYIYRNEQLVTPGAFDGKHTATAGSGTNGNYTCKAAASNIIKWSQGQIISAKVLVTRPIIQVIDRVVLGQTFRIRCFSENGSFPITYTLNRNNSMQNRFISTYQHKDATFNARIKSEQEIHEFRCEAKNSPHMTPQMSEALSAPVIVPVEKVFLTIVPTPDDVTEGHEVFLICKISKGTLPVSFRWYHSGREEPLKINTIMSNFSSHTLHKVSSEDNGSYYCEAFNSDINPQKSDEIAFTVRMARWKKGLIIGVCLLCVSAFVVFLLMRYRAKRGRESYSSPSVALAPHA